MKLENIPIFALIKQLNKLSAEKQQEETLEDDENLKVAFKASNGKYVSIDHYGILQATSDTIGANEVFRMIHKENKRMVLIASNGKYVADSIDSSQPLAASSTSIDLEEGFEVSDWNLNSVTLLTSDLKYIQLVPASLTLKALTDYVTPENVFEIIPLDTHGNKIIDPPSEEVDIQPEVDSNPKDVYTVCFSGTACTRDEGEVSRPDSTFRQGSDKDIYTPESGYIPIRIHKEISGTLKAIKPSVSIRGVGENDWAIPRDKSEPLVFDGPLKADKTLLSYVKKYSGGNQYSHITQVDGWSAPALALHAANLAVASGKEQYNFIGHSRGAVESIMAAWFIYAYGTDEMKKIPINIFAIDPVPGTGEWYGILTQLPPNVVNYVGVYAWDMCIQPGDKPFMGLVPRPNGLMTGKSNSVTLKNSSWWPWNKWKYIADDAQLTDPLKTGCTDPQPKGYKLYACRGRHSTVAGNYTSNSGYKVADISEIVAPVPELIYKMARGYLTKWGTVFSVPSASQKRVLELRKEINTDHRDFDAMGGGETRNSLKPGRPFVRRLSSIYGMNPTNSYYMDNVVGDPPYKMAYPVTKDRMDAGWVKWAFL